MSKAPKLAVRDLADLPLREVSGFALRGSEVLAVGDREPTIFTAAVDSWPLQWRGTDLSKLDLPDGGRQFEAVTPTGADTVLILQEQPARVLYVDLAGPTGPALLASMLLEVPEGHPLREVWLGDRSSRGESILLTERGHLLVVKEKDPSAILEFGPPGDQPVGWRRGVEGVAPEPADTTLTVLATWTLNKELRKQLPDISDATVGPDGCIYLLSDKGSAIARVADQLDPAGGEVAAEAVWRIAGGPESAEGLVILADGTALVGLDTSSPRRNVLRLEPLELKA